MPINNTTISVVIPARAGSTRLPGKPLMLLAGKPLIQHVYESALQHPEVNHVVVATDDQQILETVHNFQGQAVLVTDPCRTGTDRVAKIAETLDPCMIINLQVDEIILHPDLFTDLITPFRQSQALIGTLKRQITNHKDWCDPSVVKVVTDDRGRALYFSRSPIPYVRDQDTGHRGPMSQYMHLGIYMFHRDTLLEFAHMNSGALEQAEQLEQLRALEAGIPIHVWETTYPSLRIDTPEDLQEAERTWKPCVS